ncbi:MAG: hypothetical protein QXT74_03775 [Candidatus Nezhaarchaeales archaeon]
MASPSALISSALRTYDQALRTLEEALAEGSMLKMKDAASLAWEAVVDAVDALILKLAGSLPRSHFERRRLLMRLTEGDPELAEKGLYDRFVARSRLFRGELLHEDVLDTELFRLEVLKAGELLRIVEGKLRG